jgi:hypothetical protein
VTGSSHTLIGVNNAGGKVNRGIKVLLSCESDRRKPTAKILADNGVPENRRMVIPRGTSAFEEGEAIKAFVDPNGYRSVIAVRSLIAWGAFERLLTSLRNNGWSSNTVQLTMRFRRQSVVAA